MSKRKCLKRLLLFFFLQSAKQKIKCLMFDQKEDLAQVKEEGVVAKKIMEKEQLELERQLPKDMRKQKVEMRQQQLSYEALIKDMKLVGIMRGSLSDT